MNDLDLRQIVLDELEWEASVNAAHIGVVAKDGVVTLTGFVDSYAEKIAAERAVRQVKGVKAIAQEIEVRLPNARKRADDEIAKRAVDILKWNVSVPDERIKVKVEHGVVTLTGDVDWQYQRSIAEADIRRLSGVIALINNVIVKPSIEPRNIREKIKLALERTADVEAAAIGITADGGRVTLSGNVHSWAERAAAERAACSATGVTQVTDHLSIQG